MPTRLAPELTDKLAIETEQIAVLQGLLGDYPFRTYGTLVVDTQLGFALETQTLSLFENSFFTQPEERYSPIMAHELAHQWFGDSVAPAVWSDVWLNEGHATWYERTWNVDPDSPEFVELVHGGYTFADQLRFFYGPPGAPRSGAPQDVFNPNVYFGGAITLFALRQQVGDATFKAIEREWVTRYRGRSASTQDFFHLASEISGQDLQAFLTAWIYGDTTPAMPGHPDWTTDPVPTGIAARTIAPPSLPKFSVMIGTKH